MEHDGPRLTERQSSAPVIADKNTRNQEALMAAIAQRRNRMEKTTDTKVVEDIEARLNKNRKLQATKYFAGDTLKKNKKPEGEGNTKETTEGDKGNTAAAKPNVLSASGAAGDKADGKPQAAATPVVSKVPVGVATSKAGGNKPPVEVPTSKANAGKAVPEPLNKPKEIVMHKAAPAKPHAPPPPTSKTAAKPSVGTLQTKASTLGRPSTTPTSTTSQKPTSPTTKNSNTTPLPKVGTIKSNDFLALAEKARQDYLQKINGGNSTSTLKGSSGGSGTKPAAPQPETKAATTRAQPTVVEVQPANDASDPQAKVSIKDRISKLNLDGSGNRGNGFEVIGVTEDHSHTEPSLSNGTLKHRSSSNGVHEPTMVAPPADFVDGETQLEIIPPPPSFAADMGDGVAEGNMPAFGHDDAASFVSSVSSLSTLSSEQGDSKPFAHHYDDIIVPPPPPPEFGDGVENAYEEITDNFIPPPPMFNVEQTGGGGGGAKGERPFQTKAVDSWQCEDVLDWLDSLDMSQYKPSFARSAVNGKRVQHLERNDYIELGVTQVGHRMDLQRSIKRFILRHNSS